MTEEEWLGCEATQQMLEFLRGKASERRLRLFGCACVQMVWNHLKDARSKEAVEVAERVADGLASPDEARRARDAAYVAAYGKRTWAAWSAISTLGDSYLEPRRCVSKAVRLLLLRDIFGNPFRPVTVDPAWLTSDVLALARGIYDDRAFDRMPILADALQDAGCVNDDILNHCRASGPHVRGCWVVDMLLGKE